MSSSHTDSNNSSIVLGKVTRLNHPSYSMSDKHLDAQQELAELLCFGFHRVFIEFDAPVPNPTRYLYGDLNARSTKPYDLDVFAEDPIWENIQYLKHEKIAIEIDCKYGHGTKKQIQRDDKRQAQIKEYYRIEEIYGYSCHEVVGQGYKDILKKLHPCFKATDFLKWWGIILNPAVMAVLRKNFN